METWEGVVVTTIVAAIAYLFLSDKAKDKTLTSIEGKINQLFESHTEMKRDIAEDQLEMKKRQEEIRMEQQKIDVKLNLFLKNELDQYKDLTNQFKEIIKMALSGRSDK
jgi:hypothetical protein